MPARAIILVLLVLAAVAGARGADFLGGDERAPSQGGGVPGGGDQRAPSTGEAGSLRATVVRVIDGDTVVLTAIGRSRLIGIDTPELHGRRECFGREASELTKRVLRPGDRVRYRLGRESRDRYRRALIYLWLDDGRFVNELLVAHGAAVALTIAPNDVYAARLEDLAGRARRDGVGLWSRHTCAGDADARPDRRGHSSGEVG